MTVLKKVAIGVGGVIAFAHIGILGHLINHDEAGPQPPVVHLPKGPYSSYKVQAGKDGYTIEYRSDDPKVLESSKKTSSMIFDLSSLRVLMYFFTRPQGPQDSLVNIRNFIYVPVVFC